MLFRKFLDSHRRYFAPGQPWTVMASKIIALMSVAHSKYLEDLLAQQKEHGIITDRPSSSKIFKDLADNSGAVLAKFTQWPSPHVGLGAGPKSAQKLLDTACLGVCARHVESFEEADSVEPSAHLALGPAISGVAQEEQSYFVESPESPPHTFQRQDTSASSSDSPMHFNSDDIPLDDTADVQPTLPAVIVDLSPLLDDLKISLSKRMDDAQSDILSRLHTVERGLRDTLGQQNEYFRNLIQSARQDGQNQDDNQTLRFNALKKVFLAQGVTAGADSVAAIRNEQLEFQSKIAADILSLSTQLGDLVEYIRGGDAKKGKGSSRRPLPPPVNQGEGSGGDTVRTTEIAQRDIDNTHRDILERLMDGDRQRE
ncbi:beta-glucosidase 40 [Dorcoceras hygrometricum]|uniref:Beta-glucosidase 40 n=1 Tax=Dorcoceras hygrometricum TaxID=472368 RepID=A0A2Z7CT05_9LAMI|nr:beta-glucosidase 40 [Dorcoceras hygrometricum]